MSERDGLMLVRDAALLFNMGRQKAYGMARAGSFPVEVFEIGRNLMCRRADVERIAFGAETEPAPPASTASPASPARVGSEPALRYLQAQLKAVHSQIEALLAVVEQEIRVAGTDDARP